MKYRKLLIAVGVVALVLYLVVLVPWDADEGMFRKMRESVLAGIVYMSVAAVAAKLIELAAGPRWQTSIRGLLVMTAVIAVVLYVIVWQLELHAK